ncbi:hypothetical protein IT398_00200 [Candidatus Nomurabacteria bacterium]|nr:hypothetical protein [Candidatus Nomurabacteria bacterium]
MNKFFKQVSVSGLTLALPVFALAQSVTSLEGGFATIIRLINNYIIPLIIGLGVVYFLWGVLQYVTAGGDDEKKAAGRSTMIYGVIALFVMVSVWGLVNVLGGTFNFGGANRPTQIPTVPPPQGF